MEFTNDRQRAMVRNALGEYMRFFELIRPGDVALDVGAHVGGIAVKMTELGARVVAYEPDPDNFDLLLKNTRDLNVAAFNVAVTGDGRDVTLYRQAPGGSNATTSIYAGGRRRTGFTVPSVSFRSIVTAQSDLSLLKVDVEGAEIEYDWELLPPTVRAIAVELHAGHCDRAFGSRDRLVNCLNGLYHVGFKCHLKIDPTAWTSWKDRSFVLTR